MPFFYSYILKMDSFTTSSRSGRVLQSKFFSPNFVIVIYSYSLIIILISS